ncbi:MAG: NAD(P)H-dependent oxidoreductase subunit E, partial [Clostridia bacterium]|nr:NAD(P)H-dependent oxidoreductase subunit E [Clostridia bacterium]
MTHKLQSREELAALRAACKQAFAAEKTKILVCGGTGCVAGGSLDIYARLQELLKERGIPVEVELADEPHGDVVGIKKSGCHGFCEMGPLVRIEPNGWLYTKVQLSDCEEIVDETIVNGRFIERLGYKKEGEVIKKQEDIPFYKKQTRMVLESCGHINAGSIREYLALDGYSALE